MQKLLAALFAALMMIGGAACTVEADGEGGEDAEVQVDVEGESEAEVPVPGETVS